MEAAIRRLLLLIIALLIIACVAWFGYRRETRDAFLATQSLPPPPTSGQIVYAGQAPAHSFRVEGENILVRTVFETDGPSNSHLEIRDVLLPPNAKSKLPAPPGPVLVELYSGTGTLAFGENAEQSQALTNDHLRAVPQGQALQFENRGAQPLAVRLYIFGVK